MNVRMTDSWMALSAAALYCGVGVMVSGFVFNKLSHLAEYTLNKRFGDYKNPQKTLDDRVIVSMQHQDYYYTQNIVLAVLVAAISSKAVQVLALAGCPSTIAVPLLVGSVAAPILFSLFNMFLRTIGDHDGRWVEISDAEISKHGINKSNVEKIIGCARVYCSFGDAPGCFGGRFTRLG